MHILGMPVHWSSTLTFSESGDEVKVELLEHLSGQIESMNGHIAGVVFPYPLEKAGKPVLAEKFIC